MSPQLIIPIVVFTMFQYILVVAILLIQGSNKNDRMVESRKQVLILFIPFSWIILAIIGSIGLAFLVVILIKKWI